MNYRFPRPLLPAIRRTSAVGFTLSALGLLSGSYGLGKLVQSALGASASLVTIVATLLLGLLLSAAGFMMLVVAADPFEEAVWPMEPPVTMSRHLDSGNELAAESPTVVDPPPRSESRREAG